MACTHHKSVRNRCARGLDRAECLHANLRNEAPGGLRASGWHKYCKVAGCSRATAASASTSVVPVARNGARMQCGSWDCTFGHGQLDTFRCKCHGANRNIRTSWRVPVSDGRRATRNISRTSILLSPLFGGFQQACPGEAGEICTVAARSTFRHRTLAGFNVRRHRPCGQKGSPHSKRHPDTASVAPIIAQPVLRRELDTGRVLGNPTNARSSVVSVNPSCEEGTCADGATSLRRSSGAARPTGETASSRCAKPATPRRAIVPRSSHLSLHRPEGDAKRAHGALVDSSREIPRVAEHASHATSNRPAAPWPPPTHMVTMPYLFPRRFSSRSTVPVNREPVMPNG